MVIICIAPPPLPLSLQSGTSFFLATNLERQFLSVYYDGIYRKNDPLTIRLVEITDSSFETQYKYLKIFSIKKHL